jgi:hypothetical protein
MILTRTACLALLAATLAASPALAGAKLKLDRKVSSSELRAHARAYCKGWRYPTGGANYYINYKEGWFRCDDPRERGKKGNHVDNTGNHR